MTKPGTAAVVFDMDGVLIDSGVHHREAWQALLADLGVESPPDAWRLTIGRPAEEAVPLLLGRELDAADAHRLAERKREHYARLARRGMLAIPGVADFVAGLARKAVPRAVATTASRRDVESLLAEVGLRVHFDVVVAAEDVRWGKPDPEVYLSAAGKLGLPPAACVVFEDSLVGIQAARRAGMRVVGVTTAHVADELVAAGAERAIPSFEGVAWPV